MQTTWLWILGLLMAGWVLIDGAVHGSAMALRRFDPAHRRGVLTGIGPFLLAGEVWLVAAAGALIGTFPGAEHDLVRVAYPLLVLLLAGWITRDAGVWFRSRLASPGWRSWWESAAGVGAVAVATAWGLLSGALVRGLPERADTSPATLIEPYSLLWGAFMIAGFAAHGAAFAAARVPDDTAPSARTMIRPRAWAAAALGAVVAAATPLLVDDGVRPVAVVLLLIGALAFAAAPAVTAHGRDGAALGLTGLGLVASVVAVGVQVAPWLRTGAASADTLDLLGTVLLPVVVLMLAAQLWAAWLFRRRVDHASAVFY